MAVPAGYTQHTSGFWMRASDQAGPYSFDGTNLTLVTSAPAAGTAGYPAGATPMQNASGNVAAAAAVATLAAAAGKTTYCTGFTISSSGATVAAVVTATLAGLLGGTASYTYAVASGITAQNAIVTVIFAFPLPASALNTAIVLTLPSLGLGNTNATVTAYGFQL